MKTDLLIIGAGPAGLQAAILTASQGLNVKVIERGTWGGRVAGSAKIENYLGFPNGIRGDKFAALGIKQAKKFGVEFIQETVSKIGWERDRRLIQLSCGRILDGSSLLLAMGMNHRSLEIPGAEKWGVCLGMDPVEIPRFAGKRVAVIGGADSAGQAAVGLATVASNVLLFHRGDLGMSSYLKEQIGAARNIQMVQAEPRKFTGGVGVSGVECTEGDHYPFDAAFLFVGAEPSTQWIPLAKDEKGFIKTGGQYSLGTSVPGVFAAGDVRSGAYKRVSVAVGEGAAASVEILKYMALRAEERMAA